MSEASQVTSRSNIGYGLAENSRIHQCHPPKGETDSWSADDERYQLLMRNRRNLGAIYGADRVVHSAQEERLNIGHVSRNMEGDVLAVARFKRLVTAEHSAQNYDSRIRPITLANDVFSGGHRPAPGHQVEKRRSISREERRVLRRLGEKQFESQLHTFARHELSTRNAV